MEKPTKNTIMRIAILGGTGQIGSAITDGLIQAYPTAQILSCSRNGGAKLHHQKFNVYSSDWSSLGQLDVVINAVGIIEETDENTFQKAHVGVVKSLIREAEKLGNPMIVHVSVNGANVNSVSKYASTKGEADQLLMEQTNWNIIRPSFVCTPNTTIVQKVRMLFNLSNWQLGFLPVPGLFLKPKFQPVMVNDMVELIKKIIDKKLNQQLIYATGPEIYTLKDWLNIISKHKITIIPLPHWLIDKPFRMLIKLFPQIMNKDQYLLMGVDNVHDNKEFKHILGREPKSTKQFWNKELK